VKKNEKSMQLPREDRRVCSRGGFLPQEKMLDPRSRRSQRRAGWGGGVKTDDVVKLRGRGQPQSPAR